MTKTYSELCTFPTLEERFEYLKLNGVPTEETFYGSRYLNQRFYRSSEWRRVRNLVIRRDNGCELGLAGYTIPGYITIHHLNPIIKDDLVHNVQKCLDPENLICVSLAMHEALHYAFKLDMADFETTDRSPNDTTLWR